MYFELISSPSILVTEKINQKFIKMALWVFWFVFCNYFGSFCGFLFFPFSFISFLSFLFLHFGHLLIAKFQTSSTAH